MDLIKDMSPLTVAEIESSPGILSAKIIFNNLINNNLKVWVISSETQNFFFVQLQTKEHQEPSFATIAFTHEELALSYINRKQIQSILLRMFGKKIFVVGVKLTCLQDILNPMNAHTLSNLIINPNSRDFFIPIPLGYVKQMVDKRVLSYDPINDANMDIIELEYDKEERYFEIIERKSYNFIFDRQN